MTAFVRAELLSRRRMLLGLGAGAFALLAIVALSYDSLGSTGLLRGLHGHSPRALTAFSGSRSADPLSPAGWMAFGFNHPLFLTLTLTAAIAIGSGAIAGEVESGRAELIFTAPVPRSRFLYSALAVWLIAEVLILASSLAGAVIGGIASTQIRDAGLARLAWAPVQYAPLAFFVLACSLLASTFAHTRGRGTGLAIGAVVLGYLVNVTSGLVSSLDWLRWLSPFGYYDPGAAVQNGLHLAPALELTGAALVLLLLARAQLARRDLV